MIRALRNATAAELIKLWSLPAVVATSLGTIVASVTLAAALAMSAPPESNDVSLITAQAIVFLQIGPILLGVLAASTEYEGRQIVTTLTATPNRSLLLAGKAIAYLGVVVTVSVAAVSAGAATVWIVLDAHGTAPARPVDLGPLTGAAIYLVLIGLLALAAAVLMRSLIGPLVTMLALVLIVSPLLAGYTEHARVLPDRAGRLLYLPDSDPGLTPGTGALILLAWIAATALAAVVAFTRRDA
ncbi:MAG TPA: hypothetical protein PLA49_02510 [Propioniciclava sp.]|uniref:hypothetical protein n=1 Tax=Propioniciclava sp. TaxID=2038686 RepID=UPI002BDF178F|nr:hypothetical protein [Propioniciclava sp.]HRL48231.1 hypothetical protein [Propioniciclava sp.]